MQLDKSGTALGFRRDPLAGARRRRQLSDFDPKQPESIPLMEAVHDLRAIRGTDPQSAISEMIEMLATGQLPPADALVDGMPANIDPRWWWAGAIEYPNSSAGFNLVIDGEERLIRATEIALDRGAWDRQRSRIAAATKQAGEPFPHWDDPSWDQPVILLDALRLWSPGLAQRLDQLTRPWPSPDEVHNMALQREIRNIALQARGGNKVAEAPGGDPDDLDDPAIPASLRDEWARLVREWDQWDNADRAVHAFELTGRLIIEKTRRGQPYILICAPGTSRGDLRVDYRPLDQASHDKLGPHDFYLPTSYLRRQGGNWFARISGGIDAQAERMRATRLDREVRDAAATTTWNAESAKPVRERQYFLFGEIADALARTPGRLEVDVAERGRILLDLADRTCRGEFDLSGDSEVVTLIGEPPYFAPVTPVRAGEILTDPETLILRRDACRRYIQNSPLEGAPRLLRDWFLEPARRDTTRPNTGEPGPDDRAALLTPISGHVMAPDEAEGYTLLWDGAAEMSRANGQSLARNWLRLMDAFWRGDLAPDGLTYFYPAPPAGREFVVLDRTALGRMLLGHRALDTEAASIDDLRHWRVSDYCDQPAPFGAYFEHDPEGRVGLALRTWELALALRPKDFGPTMTELPAADVGLAGHQVAATDTVSLRSAPKPEIHRAITAAYDNAEATSAKPPNLREIIKPVQAFLREQGYEASGSQIQKLADAPEHKSRRRQVGKTVASEMRRKPE